MTAKHYLMRANECVKVTLFEMTTPLPLLDPLYITKQTRADEGLARG